VSPRPYFQALKDNDTTVRIYAAGALGTLRIGGQEPFTILVNCLKDRADQSDEAKWILGEIGPPALPTLKNCLQDENVKVRYAATSCIAKIADGQRHKRRSFPQEFVPPVARILKDKDTKVVVGALNALSKIGPAASKTIPEVIKFLQHRDPTLRYYAAISLEGFAPTGKIAIPALDKALDDNDWRVRRAAVQALARFRNDPEKVVPALIKALNDGEC
jgi:HEAT repeat protein